MLSKILNEYNFRIYLLYFNMKSNLNLQQRVLYLNKKELKTIDLDFRIFVNKLPIMIQSRNYYLSI